MSIDDATLEVIWSRTNGHPSLTSLVLSAYLSAAKAESLAPWLASFLMGKSFVTQIAQASHFAERVKPLLESTDIDIPPSVHASMMSLLQLFLQSYELPETKLPTDADSLRALRLLRAAGVLVAPPSQSVFRIASPILYDVLSFYFYSSPSTMAMPQTLSFDNDFVGVVIAACSVFRLPALTHAYSQNQHGFSEHIIQGELYAVLRAWASNNRTVLRESYVGRRGRQQDRLDVAVVNGSSLYVEVAVDLRSTADMEKKVTQAVKYTRLRMPDHLVVLNLVQCGGHVDTFALPATIPPLLKRFDFVTLVYDLTAHRAQVVRNGQLGGFVLFANA